MNPPETPYPQESPMTSTQTPRADLPPTLVATDVVSVFVLDVLLPAEDDEPPCRAISARVTTTVNQEQAITATVEIQGYETDRDGRRAWLVNRSIPKHVGPVNGCLWSERRWGLSHTLLMQALEAQGLDPNRCTNVFTKTWAQHREQTR